MTHGAVLESRRQLAHTADCASGARAEKRSDCDCGATEREPLWSIDILTELDAGGRPLIRVTVPAALSWVDTCALWEALHETQLRTAELWVRARSRAQRAAGGIS